MASGVPFLRTQTADPSPRSAPVGMTKWRVAAHLRGSGGRWTALTQPPGGPFKMAKWRVAAHLSGGGGGWTESTAGCPIQAVFWLEWDTTALDAKAGFAACAARTRWLLHKLCAPQGGRQGRRGLVAGRRREVQCGHCEQVRGAEEDATKAGAKTRGDLIGILGQTAIRSTCVSAPKA